MGSQLPLQERSDQRPSPTGPGEIGELPAATATGPGEIGGLPGASAAKLLVAKRRARVWHSSRVKVPPIQRQHPNMTAMLSSGM